MKALPAVQVKIDYFSLKGGLNLTTPPLVMPPGYAINTLNFECDINGGYARIKGYERFDGQDAPSDATPYIINCSEIGGTWAVGDVVTGATSGATAVYVGQTAEGLAVVMISGTFVGENLTGATGTATAIGDAPVVYSTLNSLASATIINAAADQYRALIAEVPGSGPILGLTLLNDVLYAFRNAVGDATAAIYKSTSSGWTLVPLGWEIAFTSGGTYEIVEGDVIVSAVAPMITATVTRVVLTSGAWADGDAAGVLILSDWLAPFGAVNIDVGANLNVATVSGPGDAITLAPSGRYEFYVHNFGGASGTRRIYGASGVHRGFEFDGTVFVPINTGMATDTPLHVTVHANHLFFSFDASNQHSAPGEPYVFSAVLNAGEIAVGADVTGYANQSGAQTASALMIMTRNSTFVLYGTGVGDWNLVSYQDDSGAIAYSAQRIGGTLVQDDRGITYIGNSQNYGNFESNTLSSLVQPFVRSKRTLVSASCVSREKNQYRLFYSDKTALFVTIDGTKVVGMMTVTLGHDVTCAVSDEMSDGTEAIFFGSSDGFVYQMEKGTSFDGGTIDWLLLLSYNNLRSPQTIKRFRKLMLEVSGTQYAEFSMGYQLGYNNVNLSQPGVVSTGVPFAFSQWDQFTWDQFYWDGQTLLPRDFSLEGAAENIAIQIAGSSDMFGSFTVTGALLHYTPRTRMR
jgi:hypothetical protein